ncbi:hypothetical protein [Sporosarcina sp.]|uniref:hypothetical protein n=1 Tax=Sporosarcina sp. TaxID=49982 RepID=UPI0026161A67|nr:hypothetical protein [Sporosarcina sp.]
MSKFFTKLSSLALALVVVGIGLSVNVNAAELELQVLDSNEFKNSVSHETQENIGVNDVEPGIGNKDLIIPYGTSKPTSIWNLSTKGRYPFRGSSNSSTLYTDYLLTGKSSAKIIVNNTDHQYSLKFKVKRKDLLLDSTIGGPYEIPLGKSISVTLSLNKSSNYYIEFTGPNNFNGYIE